MKTTKILLSLFAFAISITTYAQVGINTTSPKTTMDVSIKRSNADGTGTVADNSQNFGLLAPRLTRAELTANTATYSADQAGALIYVTDVSGGNTTAPRTNVTAIGYYYYDSGSNLWKAISSGGSSSITPVNGLEAPASGQVGIVDPIRFIYTPSISVSTTSLQNGLTLKIWEEYSKQFSGTGTNTLLKNTTVENATIPVYPANYFDYYVTAYDPAVFSFPANPINDSGELTYNVIGTASACSFMNIVMVLRKTPR